MPCSARRRTQRFGPDRLSSALDELVARPPAEIGALIELAYSTPQGFVIDEAEDELGTHMCIPPNWENRRSEISQLEPIETVETVVG